MRMMCYSVMTQVLHVTFSQALPGSLSPGFICIFMEHIPGHINAAKRCNLIFFFFALEWVNIKSWQRENPLRVYPFINLIHLSSIYHLMVHWWRWD